MCLRVTTCLHPVALMHASPVALVNDSSTWAVVHVLWRAAETPRMCQWQNCFVCQFWSKTVWSLLPRGNLWGANLHSGKWRGELQDTVLVIRHPSTHEKPTSQTKSFLTQSRVKFQAVWGHGTFFYFHQAFPDNAAGREIASLPAKCPNPGCSWTGSIKEYEVWVCFCFLFSSCAHPAPIRPFMVLLQEQQQHRNRKWMWARCGWKVPVLPTLFGTTTQSGKSGTGSLSSLLIEEACLCM